MPSGYHEHVPGAARLTYLGRLATQCRLPCREVRIVRKAVGRTPWSARVPLDPLFAQPNRPNVIPERPIGASALTIGRPPHLI
jgi:hypothetical protein